MDRSDRTRAALNGFFDRQRKAKTRQAAPRKKGNINASPEKLVEEECLRWFKAMGWSGQVYESKSKFINGRWTKSGLVYGTADWGGVTHEGHGAFVEFKAKGRLSTFWKEGNERQQKYILDKINAGAFSVVVDSYELLNKFYLEWDSARKISMEEGKDYLHSALPKRPAPKPTCSDLYDWMK